MRTNREGKALALALSAAVFLLFGSSVASAATTTLSSSPGASSGPTSLTISTVPPRLPADGGSYPAIVVSLEGASGSAAIAPQNITVFLTSSLPGLGSIEGQVTIIKNTAFAVANFTTTNTPGMTTISASSSGLSPASGPLTTVIPSGYPTRLAVVPVPGTQIASPGSQGTLIVEALDSSGFPARESVITSVTLSSSDDAIVSVPSTLTLGGGEVLTSTTYTLGTQPGKVSITAASSGHNSGTAAITIVGASPAGVALSAEPNPIATSTSGVLVVTLTTAQGQPTPAPDSVSVVISSSNTTLVNTTQMATIGQGQVYAVVSFQSGQAQGTVTITASSAGLMSGSTQVTVAKPGAAAKLGLVMSPNPFPADNQSYSSMVVELESDEGGPAVAASAVSVTLTSSNSNVGQVIESLTIPSGSSYTVANFASTYLAGSTYVTAIAQNLQSVTLSLTSSGPTPSQIVAQAVPPVLPADGASYSALVVSLEDSGGAPAIAPTNTLVQLTSSNTGVLAVNNTLTIPAGQSYAVTMVTTSSSPGATNVTATAPGFAPSETGFSTVSLAPTKLAVYVGPNSTIASLGHGTALVAVQVQDSTSSPGRAAQDATVQLTSSNSSMMSKSVSLEIPTGSDYGWAFINATQSGSTTFTASSSGFASGGARVTVVVPAVTFTLSASPASIPLTGAAVLQVQLQLMGSPLPGVPVTVSSTSGAVGTPSGITDQSGSFSDTFIPVAAGVAIITATANAAPFGNQTATATVQVLGHGGLSGTGLQSPTAKLIDTLLPPVIVIAIILIVVVMVRRTIKRRRETSEEQTDEQ